MLQGTGKACTHLMKTRFFDVWQDIEYPSRRLSSAASSICFPGPSKPPAIRGKIPLNGLVNEVSKRQLRHVVKARASSAGFPGGLHGWEQQTDQGGDNGDHNE